MAKTSQVELLENSFAKLKNDKIRFTERFYARLFETSPELEPLFAGTTIQEQSKKLYAALVLLVENLRHPAELERVLKPLGERHIGYGTIPQHYPLIGGALLSTLEEFLGDTQRLFRQEERTFQNPSRLLRQFKTFDALKAERGSSKIWKTVRLVW